MPNIIGRKVRCIRPDSKLTTEHTYTIIASEHSFVTVRNDITGSIEGDWGGIPSLDISRFEEIKDA